jgi:hypothetical protein
MNIFPIKVLDLNRTYKPLCCDEKWLHDKKHKLIKPTLNGD